MKSIVCFCLLSFLIVASAMAAPGLRVTYVDGTAYIGSDNSWKRLGIGDSVSTESTVRLDAGASLDIKGLGADLYLMQKGSYRIRDLLAARRKLTSPGIGAAISAKLKGMLKGPTSNQSAVAGVRGADESRSSDSDWVENGFQESLQKAKDEIRSERYAEAIDTLEAATDAATAEELPELRYNLAYAYSQSGDTPNASRQLFGLSPVDGAPWSLDYVLLRAKVDLDANAFDQAIQWLTTPRNDLSRDADRASLYYFLLGLGYRGLGDPADEQLVLDRLVATDGDSELGKAAARLLKDL